MKKICILLVLLCTIQGSGLFAQAGILDNSFGANGKVITPVGAGGEVWSMCAQDDWTIVVGGYEIDGPDSVFSLSRYLRNGNLDSTFGTNGKVSTAMGAGDAMIHAIVKQPDGKILAAGWAWNGNNFDYAIARYNVNGSLDATFGNNGKVITAIGPGDDVGTSLLLKSDWTIVVGGSSMNGTKNDFAMMAYNTNGTIDSTFGNNGVVLTTMGNGDGVISAMALQGDSSIIVAGTVSDNTANHFALARYHANGTLDNSFGTGGKVIVTGGANDDEAFALTLQNDGKILAGGYSGNGINDDFGVMRFLANGALDPGFGVNGKVTTSLGDSDEAVYGMLLQPDGKIIGIGSSIQGATEQYAMARYNTDGTLDNNFGTNGKVVTVMSSGNNEAYTAGFQPDGKIVVAGYANDGVQKNFSVARYITDLNLGVIDFNTNNKMLLIYPNPVPQNATLKYSLNEDETVSIRLLDMDGKQVETFVNIQKQTAGEHTQQIIFPEGLATGSYLIDIVSPHGQMSIKIIR